MKIIFMALMLLSFLHSDEMQRIESIVKDISELRSEYDKCQVELKAEKMSHYIDTDESKKELLKKIDYLEKQVKKQEEVLKTKELTIKNLTNTLKSSSKKTTAATKTCKEANDFPELMMKEDHQEKIVTFKACPFVLNVESIIYDGINGKKIDKWGKGTSFTSNKETKSWIQITGYFVNKKWVIAKKDMWLKKAQVSKK